MKRTLMQEIPVGIPEEFGELIRDARIYDSSCSPEARVMMIDRDEGFFLKNAPKGSLFREAELTAFFHAKRLAPEVIAYRSDERDWLLTRRARGEDATHASYLSDPKRLCDLLAERLRALHETDPTGCPVTDRVSTYCATAKEGYRMGRADLSYLRSYQPDATVESAWRIAEEHHDTLKNEVLLHGDYCLPNVMLDSWRFSAFIDLGNGGVGDRHIDLYWGVWTLAFNLGTDAYGDRFLDAYGRDMVETEKLRAVAAFEVFG